MIEEAVKLCMRLTNRFSRATKKREYIVVSVGGSLLVPEAIDTAFLEQFRTYILNHLKRGFSFYIVAGGGMTARSYQHAVQAMCDLHPEDVDWLGIHATRLNAHLLRTIFKDEAQDRIIKNPSRGIRGTAPIIIGAGWRPGWSTDYCAVMAAKQLGAKRLVNLSNIKYVYTADPKKDPTATPIERIGWSDFRTIIPDHWDPGLSSPFDPVASKLAQELNMEVAIISGADLESFDSYISGKPFTGTVIS